MVHTTVGLPRVSIVYQSFGKISRLVFPSRNLNDGIFLTLTLASDKRFFKEL